MKGRGEGDWMSEGKEGVGSRTVGRSRLTLAVIAVIVTCEEGSVNVDRVSDGLAEAVSGERHVEGSVNWGIEKD